MVDKDLCSDDTKINLYQNMDGDAVGKHHQGRCKAPTGVCWSKSTESFTVSDCKEF